MWLPPEHPLLGAWPATQACALAGNQTRDPLVHSPVLSPLSPTSQGRAISFLRHAVVIGKCRGTIFSTQENSQTCLEKQPLNWMSCKGRCGRVEDREEENHPPPTKWPQHGFWSWKLCLSQAEGCFPLRKS